MFGSVPKIVNILIWVVLDSFSLSINTDENVVVVCDLDMELMKEKFAKLLLGEDMSGGGKGVSSALALSNAITNLAGKFF